MAFEWNPGYESICHWFEFDTNKNEIKYISSEKTNQSLLIQKLTPFDGMNNKTYINWFKRNRKKKKLLPIFKFIENRFLRILKEKWVIFREQLIDIFLSLGIKKIRSEA